MTLQQQTQQQGGGVATAVGRSAARYAWYVLFVLTVANFFNNLDRYYFSIALEAIKKDLHASDTQMSLLTGLAFALLHGVASIPAARLSDRTIRRTLLGVALALWSAATAACGIANSFMTMALARASVGVGEAGAIPPSLSILSDYFERRRRPMVMNVFYSANAIALALGLPLVGLLVQNYGWRSAFYVLGLLGLLFAPVVLFTVKEPVRGSMDVDDPAATAAAVARPSIMTCLKMMAANRPFMMVLLSQFIVQMGISANAAFEPAFFIRFYNLSYAQAAALTGIPFGTAGLLAAIVGGAVTSHLVKRTGNDQWMARVPALAALAGAVMAVLSYWGGSFLMAAVFGVLIFVFIMVRTGTTFALSLDYMPTQIRSLTTAVLLIVQSVLAGTIGPLMVGTISDHLTPQVGKAEALRTAMIIVVPICMGLGGLLGFQKVGRRSSLPGAPAGHA